MVIPHSLGGACRPIGEKESRRKARSIGRNRETSHNLVIEIGNNPSHKEDKQRESHSMESTTHLHLIKITGFPCDCERRWAFQTFLSTYSSLFLFPLFGLYREGDPNSTTGKGGRPLGALPTAVRMESSLSVGWRTAFCPAIHGYDRERVESDVEKGCSVHCSFQRPGQARPSVENPSF
ncbi:hypothetical protein SUGI_1373220 [Cryptomeria japonica]|uniref:Uncharacterized protein n=1 Tax=Cryptomeria japonica TaxID=3369 RepID=A0AAD3NRI2_CRYJA|nr:hypothetical protein SUGI_1373220 [Cryptomeria japonica]